MELTVNTPLVGLILTVLINLGVVVWAAAKFSSRLAHLATTFASELAHLAKALDKLSTVLDQTSARVQNHEVRLSVLENRGGRRQDDPEP
jgi:hypothetical protein